MTEVAGSSSGKVRAVLSAEDPVVLFDLYGTLVPGGSRDQRDGVAHAVAEALEVDPGALAKLFRDTFHERTTGRLGDLKATIVELAARLGSAPDAAAVDRAAQLRLELNASLLAASWALPLLDRLRAHNVTIGVVSDCSAETPEAWTDCALARRVDATAFSCLLGVRKPDPAIYRAALNELGARPEQCMFIGDGASNELSGARDLGIRAIRYDDAGFDPTDRPNQEVAWNGERITELSEVLTLLRL